MSQQRQDELQMRILAAMESIAEGLREIPILTKEVHELRQQMKRTEEAVKGAVAKASAAGAIKSLFGIK